MKNDGQAAMEAFFGGTIPSGDDLSSPLNLPPRRNIRRGVWSATPREEDEWVAALLSASSRFRRRRRRGGGGGDSDGDSCTDDDDDASRALHNPRSRGDEEPAMRHAEVPKMIHFIWLGGSPIPSFPFLRAADGDGIEHNDDDDRADDGRRRNECMDSWRRHHPPSRGWKIHLWTESDIVDSGDADESRARNRDEGRERTSAFRLDVSTMHNARGYRHAMRNRNYGMASDVLRLEILNEYGGVYVDVDYWCVDRLDDVFLPDAPHDDAVAASNDDNYGRIQFFCGASNAGCVELNNGLMACRRGGHPILRDMMRSIRDYFIGVMSSQPSSPAATTLMQRRDSSVTSLFSSFLDNASASALESAQRIEKRHVSPMEVIENTGPGLLTRTLCRRLAGDGSGRTNCDLLGEDSVFDSSGVAVFPSGVFHPFPNRLRKALSSSANGPADESSSVDRDSIDCGGRVRSEVLPSRPRSMLEAFVVPGETKAVHLWGCSWQRR